MENLMSSVRKLLAESRRSKDAVKYELGEDGTILSKTIRPARGPYTPGRLTPEERLFILTTIGSWPEDLPAEAHVGVQATDLGYGIFETRQELRRTGIMSGVWAGAEKDPDDEV
jgi:hypothetical protein